MKSVMFMGRYDFVHLIRQYDEKDQPLNNDYAIISISDNVTELKEMEQHIYLHTNNSNKIMLAFQDVDHNDNGGMSNRQAKALFEFIKKNEGKTFLVHCFAGVSRSAAVAKFINDYYDLNDHVCNSYKIYNKLVYNKLNALCGTMSLEDYYRQLEEEDRRD